jgi:serine/threonine protein phosphatase 1
MLNHTLEMSLDDDRHLVVGDIHGRYDMFMRLLDRANYDPTKDVVYSVGDMIDRGPDSVKVLEFFQQERCYAVKGNHELMAMDIDWWDTWIHNGGAECREDLHRHGRDDDWMKDILRPLPWVIEVGEDGEDGAFRIVHAEMPPGWSDAYFRKTFNEALNTDDPSFSRTVWGRNLVYAGAKNVANMLPTTNEIEFHPDRNRLNICGHTPVPRALKVGDVWFIDTWRSKTMTLIDAVTEEKFVEPLKP